MEQVYYTQCPVGYGLGIASGFQVKRRSKSYPPTADYRHLSLRPFRPGTRELAPPALRYRREVGAIEVAWLKARSHEYETENDRLWGRPGGQFAHGIHLTEQEFLAIDAWPAGLFGAAFWAERDPVRTLDQTLPEPPPIRQWPPALDPPPELARLSAWAAGATEDWLAELLAGLAWAAGSQRTLFLIDAPERLREWTALLTFLFPVALRRDLTFSTYHDRPEELSGFRLQGTVPEARPNRAVLARLGLVADGTTHTIDPPRPPPPFWARTLAGWLRNPVGSAASAWSEMDSLARQAALPDDPEQRWSEEWLNALVRLGPALQVPAPVPTDAAGWTTTERLVPWCRKAGLLTLWAEAHDAGWWQAALRAKPSTEARTALLRQLASAEGWHEGGAPGASSWGETVAVAVGQAAGLVRPVAALLARCPRDGRGAFLAGLVCRLAPPQADALLAGLKQDPTFEASLLVPVEAVRVASAVRSGTEPVEAREIVGRGIALPDATASTLEAIAREVQDDARSRTWFAGRLADALEIADAPGWPAAWSWALQRIDSARWLEPFLKRALARPDWRAIATHLRRQTKPGQRAALARAALQAGRAENVRPEAFVWCVENLLLPEKPEWQRDPSWPNAYLDRVDGLDLVDRVFRKNSRDPALVGWLRQARGQGRLLGVHEDRLARADAFASLIARNDLAALSNLDFPDVPEPRRGELLDRLVRLGEVGSPSLARVLEACRLAWPGGFDPGQPGLPGLGQALARRLASLPRSPERWLIEMRKILRDLDPEDERRGQASAEGLGAHVVAAALRDERVEDRTAWRLRRVLFEDDGSWRMLCLDARRCLAEADDASFDAAQDRWYRELPRHSETLTSRWFELMLNAPGPDLRGRVAQARLAELTTVGPIAWWVSERGEGVPDDLREAFARELPFDEIERFAPAEMDRLADWLARPDARRPVEEGRLCPLDEDATRRRRDLAAGAWGFLSASAKLRWDCLEAVGRFVQNRAFAPTQWALIDGWTARPLPIGRLSVEDRYAFLSAMISAWDHFDPNQGQLIDRLARWMTEQAGWNVAWLQDWPSRRREPPGAELIRQRRALVLEITREVSEYQDPARPRGR